MKKFSFWLEIPLFYSFLVGLNFIFAPQTTAFSGIEPHPYWIGILLFGFRYGILAGFTAGLFSSFLYLGQIWFFGERYLFEDLSFYFQPSLFLIVGALLGMGVERYRAGLVLLQKEKGMLLANEKILKEEIETTKEINTALEKRIVTKMATVITLYEGARSLESIQLADLYPSILKFVAKTLKATEAAIYLKTKEGWELKESFGWKAFEKRPVRFKTSEGIAGLAGTKNKILTVRDFLTPSKGQKDFPTLLGDCLMAGPLKRGESGEVVGVLAIHEIPFFSFNSAAVNLFAFLLDWASRSLGRAYYVAELKEQEILDPELNVYSHRYFLSRLEQELSRSRTYYLPLSLGLVNAEGIASLSPAKQRPFLTMLAQALKESVRDLDVVARFSEGDIPFALLLMTASQAHAEKTKQKILENFSKLPWPHPLKIGIASFSPTLKTSEVLMAEAKKDLKNGA